MIDGIPGSEVTSIHIKNIVHGISEPYGYRGISDTDGGIENTVGDFSRTAFQHFRIIALKQNYKVFIAICKNLIHIRNDFRDSSVNASRGNSSHSSGIATIAVR